jgi:AcrR family transcriptional regulator
MTFSTTAELAPTRAAERADRLVAAARDLANETGSAAFTVAHLVERAGGSLKGFYASFDGKDDLLVALLAADSRAGAEVLEDLVDRHRSPQRRLRAFVDGIFAMATLPDAAGYAGVLVREHRRLAEHRPEELARALSPLVDLLADELAAATRAGVAGSPDPAQDAATVFALMLNGLHEVTVGADSDTVTDHLWRFCWNGLQAR